MSCPASCMRRTAAIACSAEADFRRISIDVRTSRLPSPLQTTMEQPLSRNRQRRCGIGFARGSSRTGS
jgi:hypothetical protein